MYLINYSIEMSTNNPEDGLNEKIVEIAKKHPKGISDKDIKAAMPELSPAELVSAINKLLQQGCLDLYNKDGALIYK